MGFPDGTKKNFDIYLYLNSIAIQCEQTNNYTRMCGGIFIKTYLMLKQTKK